VTCIQKEEEVRRDKYNDYRTIIRIPDKLWDEIKMILPKEKPSRTIGRPVIPYRKVLDGIFSMSLEQDVSGSCFPKNMVQVPPVTDNSKNGIKEVFSKNMDQTIENL
jgi:hypothetical protein